jgi:FkbM family methyltransferase
MLRKKFIDTVEPPELRTRMVIDPTDPFQLDMWLGAYQPHVVSLLRHTIKPDATVLVAGLQVGYVAAIAARLAGARGKVLSAEPDPAAIDAASRNLGMLDAGCAPVYVLAGGLSDSDGSLTINLSSTLGHSSFAAPHHPRTQAVALLRRGDEWLREQGVHKLDVLVLDVEGWECHVLRGLTGVIAQSPQLMALIEVSPWALRDAGSSVSMLFDWLLANGFDVRWAQRQQGRYGVSGEPADASIIRASDVLCVRKPPMS